MWQTHVVPRRKNFDKIVFTLAFIIGGAGAVVLKIRGLGPLPTAAFPVIVLVVYAVAAFSSKEQARLEAENIGDNCYYLGFLFTLTSIAVTLYLLSQNDAEHRPERIPEVISGFGVALSTTITGVFLRVMMMQFRQGLATHERESALDVIDAAGRFRNELALSVRRIKDFTVESVQHAAERDAAMRQATESLTEEMRQRFLQAAENFAPELSAAIAQQSAAAIAEMQSATAKITGTLVEEIKAACAAMGQAGDNLRAADAEAGQVLAQSFATIQARADILARESLRLTANIEIVQRLFFSSARQLRDECAASMGEIRAFSASAIRQAEESEQAICRIIEATAGHMQTKLLAAVENFDAEVSAFSGRRRRK